MLLIFLIYYRTLISLAALWIQRLIHPKAFLNAKKDGWIVKRSRFRVTAYAMCGVLIFYSGILNAQENTLRAAVLASYSGWAQNLDVDAGTGMSLGLAAELSPRLSIGIVSHYASVEQRFETISGNTVIDLSLFELGLHGQFEIAHASNLKFLFDVGTGWFRVSNDGYLVSLGAAGERRIQGSRSDHLQLISGLSVQWSFHQRVALVVSPMSRWTKLDSGWQHAVRMSGGLSVVVF